MEQGGCFQRYDMEYIKKEDAVNMIQKFIDARKNKNCSKQAIVERKAFEYALTVVKSVKTYDFDEKN